MNLKPDELEFLAEILDTHMELIGDQIREAERLNSCINSTLNDAYLSQLVKNIAMMHSIRARIARQLLMPIDTEISIIIPNDRQWN
jgi:hypothetical protein